MSQNDQSPRQQIAPISNEAKSPADRVRQIQELQRQAEAQAAGPSQQPVVAQAQAPIAQAAAGLHVPDAFNVRDVSGVVSSLISPKPTAAQQGAYAKAQASTQALFGGNNPEITLTGNPWKVIPFGDSLPAIFDTKKPLADYEAKVPEQAIATELGALFEVSLAPKAAKQEPVQKRAVLVDGGGRLAGAECRSSADAERLFKGAPWLLPQSAMQPAAKWSVAAGKSSAFELSIERAGAKREVHALNNFARPVDAKAGAAGNIDLAHYFRDGFDAARV